MGRTTICFAASSGGHLEQLLVLSPLFERYNGFILTEKTKINVTYPVSVEYVRQINRHEIDFIPNLIINSIKSLCIFLKRRPNLIISTGVLATVPICLIGKLFGAKLVYIESFAKIDSPTLTGKILYPVADVFYVQWESMLDIYPKARYVGGIY